MREQIRDQILAQGDRAQEQVRLVLSDPNPTQEFVCQCVFRYVCYKFLLEPEEACGIKLADLAEQSIDKALDLHIPLAKESEVATTCGAAGDTAMKQALLLTAVNREFQAGIDPRRLGQVRDTEELGRLVWQARVSTETSV